ncbi:hypothetical protein [Candidatus Clavichlamydia salmonicola]|nr:hypothetical protein [Candidatus Clavichlamydia salmonicola]
MGRGVVVVLFPVQEPDSEDGKEGAWSSDSSVYLSSGYCFLNHLGKPNR